MGQRKGGKKSRRRTDSAYRRHGAWERAKKAFGPGDIAEQLTRLERIDWACPRMLLAAAIHSLLSAGTHGAARILRQYLESFAPARESLTQSELEALVELERSMAGRPRQLPLPDMSLLQRD